MSAPRATPLNGGYDQNLLAATPEVSKAARQEGYNVDLLKEDGLPPPPQRNTAHRSTDLLENGHRAPVPYAKENYGSGPITRQKIPWWRSRAGIIAVVVLLIVIIGAVVGGAVGGTVGKKNKTEVGKGTQSVTGNSNSSDHGSSVSVKNPDTAKSTDTGEGGRDHDGGAQATQAVDPNGQAPTTQPTNTAGFVIRWD